MIRSIALTLLVHLLLALTITYLRMLAHRRRLNESPLPFVAQFMLAILLWPLYLLELLTASSIVSFAAIAAWILGFLMTWAANYELSVRVVNKVIPEFVGFTLYAPLPPLMVFFVGYIGAVAITLLWAVMSQYAVHHIKMETRMIPEE